MIGSSTLLLRLVPPLSSENNVQGANEISGRKQGQRSSHGQRKDARWFQWHQLHDVNDDVQPAHSNQLTLPRYVRGSTQDYDDWAALAEDQGWSHAEMINYMRKHQTLEPIDESITEVKAALSNCQRSRPSRETDRASSVALCPLSENTMEPVGPYGLASTTGSFRSTPILSKLVTKSLE